MSGPASRLSLVAAGLVLAHIISPHAASADIDIDVHVDGECADDAVVRRAIAEALAAETDVAVTVEIACTPAIVARVLVVRRSIEAERVIEVSEDERADLPDAVALIAVVAVETASRARELAPGPDPAPPAQPEELAAPLPATPPTIPRRDVFDVMLRGGAWAGLTPSITPSLGVGVAIHPAALLTLELELSATTPVDTAVASGRVRMTMLGSRLAACVDGAPAELVELGGCVGIWGGGMLGEGVGFTIGNASAWEPWIALDGRLRATVVVDWLFLRAEVALAGALVGPTFVVTLDGARHQASQLGPLLGWAGLAVGARFSP